MVDSVISIEDDGCLMIARLLIEHRERDSFVMLDEAVDLGGIETLRRKSVLLLLQSPTANRIEIGDAQKDPLIDHFPQWKIILFERSRDGDAPGSIGILFTFELVDRLSERLRVQSGGSHAPAFQDDDVDRGIEDSLADPIIAPLVERRNGDGSTLSERCEGFSQAGHVVGSRRSTSFEEPVKALSHFLPLRLRPVEVVETDRDGSDSEPLAGLHEKPRQGGLPGALSATEPDDARTRSPDAPAFREGGGELAVFSRSLAANRIHTAPKPLHRGDVRSFDPHHGSFPGVSVGPERLPVPAGLS